MCHVANLAIIRSSGCQNPRYQILFLDSWGPKDEWTRYPRCANTSNLAVSNYLEKYVLQKLLSVHTFKTSEENTSLKPLIRLWKTVHRERCGHVVRLNCLIQLHDDLQMACLQPRFGLQTESNQKNTIRPKGLGITTSKYVIIGPFN